jgi:hypothetical protein
MPNINDNEALYDVVTLGGLSSPGKVTLSGHDSKVEWDVKNGPSQNGASTTLKSIPLVQFSASFYLVNDVAQGIDDQALWPAFAAQINSTVSGPKPKALEIYHPDLAANGIKSVVKAEIGGMTYDGRGGATVVVKFQEYRAPKTKGGTPSGSKKTPTQDPNQDAKDAIDRLVNQYKVTPSG